MEAALQLLAQRQQVAHRHEAALAAAQSLQIGLGPACAAILLREDRERSPLISNLDAPAPLARFEVPAT